MSKFEYAWVECCSDREDFFESLDEMANRKRGVDDYGDMGTHVPQSFYRWSPDEGAWVELEIGEVDRRIREQIDAELARAAENPEPSKPWGVYITGPTGKASLWGHAENEHAANATAAALPAHVRPEVKLVKS